MAQQHRRCTVEIVAITVIEGDRDLQRCGRFDCRVESPGKTGHRKIGARCERCHVRCEVCRRNAVEAALIVGCSRADGVIHDYAESRAWRPARPCRSGDFRNAVEDGLSQAGYHRTAPVDVAPDNDRSIEARVFCLQTGGQVTSDPNGTYLNSQEWPNQKVVPSPACGGRLGWGQKKHRRPHPNPPPRERPRKGGRQMLSKCHS